MTTSIACYEPSGRIGASTGFIFAGVCVAGAVAGYVYQSCLRASNNVNMHWLLLFGFGIILLVGGIFAVRKGHCRSRFWAGLSGVLLAAFFLVASFLTDYELGLRKVALARPEVNLDDLRRELGFRKWLELRKQTGWNVVGIKLTGGAVILVWILEFAWVFAFAMGGAMGALTVNPYCERCGQWTSKREFVLPGGVLETAKTYLARGDLTSLLALRHGTGSTSSRNLVLNINLCPKCRQTAFLSVQARTVGVDRNSRPSETNTTLLTNAILTPQQTYPCS